MIRCAVSRGSKAASRLPAARRLNSTNPNELEPQSSKNDDASSPLPRPPLPLSPLMDPLFIAAREKHHLPKARPDPQERTQFQNQLRNNPYALALATPIRMCNITKATLPKFFLQDYNLLAHPETGEPWWMPSGLTRKQRIDEESKSSGEASPRKERYTSTPLENPKETGISQDREVEIGELGKGLDYGTYDEISSMEGLSSTRTGLEGTKMGEVISNRPSNDPRLLGPTVYTIARKEFLHAISNKKKIGYSAEFQKHFIDSQLLKNPRSRQLFSKARWRVDIDEFLLELMRRRVVEDLSGLLKLKRGYVVGCKDWAAAFSKTQTGAYLWTGKGEENQPSEFVTLDLGVTKKQKIPTHNLNTLLGEEKLEELKAKFGNKIFDSDILTLRHRRRTVDLQMKLWKLQGYLAEYRETPGFEME